VVPLLTTEDAARILNIRTRAIYGLVEERDPSKRLPAIRIGRRLRFRQEDLDRFIDQRRSA
jgi:excisionase family DNA binding protein